MSKNRLALFIELYEAVAELPRLDLRLQLPLPRLLSPALERLRSAIADEDSDEFEESLPAAWAGVDSHLVRAQLARSVIALRNEGRIPRDVAAAALLDLDSEGEAVIRQALVAALAVDCGAARTRRDWSWLADSPPGPSSAPARQRRAAATPIEQGDATSASGERKPKAMWVLTVILVLVDSTRPLPGRAPAWRGSRAGGRGPWRPVRLRRGCDSVMPTPTNQ